MATTPIAPQTTPAVPGTAAPASIPGLEVTFGLRRYHWVNSKTRQMALIVGDRSGSMDGQKVKDANAAIAELVAALAEPTNKDAFDIAVVTFGSGASVQMPLTKATEATAILASRAILRATDWSTDITAGLVENERILDTGLARAGIEQLRPVTLLFSDGCHNVSGASPEAAADRIKTRADLVTVAFGSDADEKLLRRVASTPQHFYRCTSGRELRAFLATVGQTMSRTLARGQNATQALGQLPK